MADRSHVMQRRPLIRGTLVCEPAASGYDPTPLTGDPFVGVPVGLTHGVGG